MATTVKKKSKKTRKIIQNWRVYIKAWFNNTLVSVTDEKWNVLTWATWGSAWFKWAREATPYAAQTAVEQAVEQAKTYHQLENVDVYVKWIGIWREQAIRWIINVWVNLSAIYDTTPIPHNWCRKKKVRKL